MKKIALALLALFALKSAGAQTEDKSFRFGLQISPSINWYKPDDNKRFEKGKSAFKFGYGLLTEFKIGGHAYFSTGLQIHYAGGTIGFKDTVNFQYKDDEIRKPVAADNTPTYLHKLNERTYKVTYLTIPVGLRLRTRDIGGFTYFGYFGIDASIRLKGRSNDNVNSYTGGTTYGPRVNIEDNDITADMNLLRFGLNLGLGTEFNLSGSTNIFVGLNFVQGFSNVARGESKYLFNRRDIQSPLKQKFYNHAVALNIGVFF